MKQFKEIFDAFYPKVYGYALKAGGQEWLAEEIAHNVFWAQRKIPVDLHFIVRLRHKASGAALGLSCAVCFEQPAGVFAGCGAVCQAKILASLKIKNGISLTPLN